MRRSQLERLIEARRKKQTQEEMTLEGLMLLLLDGERRPEKRHANPTQRAFIESPARLKAYMGPAGCAKTSTICASGWLRALLQPGSKGLVARANYNDLMDTTGLRMTEMLNRLPKGVLLDRDKSPPMKWWIQAVPTLSPEGDVLDDEPSQITFMGLQDGMGSYEFNWAIIDEVAEVAEARVHEVNTRLRNKGGNYSVGMAFNPPDKHHWLYTACTGRDFQDRKVREPWMDAVFLPQPNENERNLPPDYYERLAASLPEDMKQRLIHGQWGSTFEGQPVYREFKYDLHVIDGYEVDPYAPVYRFWDFGYRRPYCCWAQFDMHGRLVVFHEHLGENQEIVPFARSVKRVTEEKFPECEDVIDYGDPAVRQKKDTGSTLVELSKEGITIRWRVATIDASLAVVRVELERIIDGKPALLFERRGVPILIGAMRGGYRMSDDGQKPDKDGYYDHPADAYRYGVFNLCGGGGTRTGGKSVAAHLPASIAYTGANDRYGR